MQVIVFIMINKVTLNFFMIAPFMILKFLFLILYLSFYFCKNNNFIKKIGGDTTTPHTVLSSKFIKKWALDLELQGLQATNADQRSLAILPTFFKK